MANLAAAFRAAVTAAHPFAVVQARGRNWIRQRITNAPDGRARFVLDAGIGPLHFGALFDQEIDTAWEVDAGVWQWRMLKAEYEARSKASFNGAPLIEYRVGVDWVTLQPRQLDWTNDRGDVQVAGSVQAISAAPSDDRLMWSGAFGTGRDFEWQTQTARLAKRVILASYASLPAPSTQILTGGNPVLRPQFQFAYSDTLTVFVDGMEWSGGNRPTLDTTQPIEFRRGDGSLAFAFGVAHVFDASDVGEPEIPGLVQRVHKAGANLLVEVRVPQTWLETAVYPVVIDPTIDKTVAASSDDANEIAGTVNITRTDSNIVDATNEYFGARWSLSGAPIPSGATIDICYVTINYNSATLDEPNHPMRFQEAASPATFTTATNDISSRPMTTASVTWSSTDLGAPGDFNSPELKTVLQEVVDSQGELSAIVWIIQGSATGTRDFECTTYDGSTTLAPRLHVEYTSSGPQTISAAGAIASAEAFGSQRLNLSAVTTAIASTEAFGSQRLNLSLAPSTIASAEAFGSARLNFALLLSGIASAEIFGAATVVQPGGAQTILPSAIASAEAFGSARLILILSPAAIASAEAFGATRIALMLLPAGIASVEAFGAARIALVLLPAGIASAEAFGVSRINFVVVPTGIASAEVIGAAIVSQAGGAQILTPAGIASVEAFGLLRITLFVAPNSILTAEAFGNLVIRAFGPGARRLIKAIQRYAAYTGLRTNVDAEKRTTLRADDE